VAKQIGNSCPAIPLEELAQNCRCLGAYVEGMTVESFACAVKRRGTPPSYARTSSHCWLRLGRRIDFVEARKLGPAEVIEMPAGLRTANFICTYAAPVLKLFLPAQSIDWPGWCYDRKRKEEKVFDFRSRGNGL